MDETGQQDLWIEAQITRKENEFFQKIIACESQEAVEAAMTFATFINQLGLTPENYPIFLSMLENENYAVIDALIGDMDPFKLLTPVQPNLMIVSKIFAMMIRWSRGGIYPKNLSVILGVLQANFSSPEEGFRIYPLKIADVNGVGKHLDKGKSQDNPVNRAILDILDSISHLNGEAGSEKEAVAMQAAAIRNAFFDDTKRMEDVIPAGLLTKESGRRQMIVPRKQTSVEQLEKKSGDAEPAKEKAKRS